MLVRVAFAVTCSLVAVTVSQLKGRRGPPPQEEEPPPVEEVFDDDEGKEIYTYADAADASKSEEEEVKRISISVCPSPALSSKSFQDSEQLLLPEIDDLFQGGTVIEFPSDSERSVKFRDERSKLKYDSDDSFDSRRYDSNSEDDEALDIFESLTISHSSKGPKLDDESSNTEMTIVVSDSAELTKLKALVEELQQKEVRLEAELLQYYGLKEQEKDHIELERQLRRKNTEIEKLNGKMKVLEEQKKTLSEELKERETLKKELEAARAKIKDLQKTIQSDAGQTKAQLLILKQQVATLQAREQEASKRDFDTERKMQTLKELEVEVVELRRTSKELQHQKREITVQLAAAEAKITELTNMSESDVVARVKAEASSLQQAYDDLSKQVEGLQINRFSEVEELVYLRWVNACLRYELRNYQAPPGKFTALDLGKNLSPRSQEKAKHLMMEYAGPDLLAAKLKEQNERDFDAVSSVPSTPSEYEFDESVFDSHSARQSASKKPGLMKKLKKWGRSKDESQLSPASSSLDLRASPMHKSATAKGLEGIIMRNNSDSVAITSYGTNETDSSGMSNADVGGLDESFKKLAPIRTRQSDMDASTGDVAASFQLMAKSVAGVLEDKYPAFKDRHKLALAREKAIKEKAEQARAEKFKAEPYVPTKVENKFTPGKLAEKLKTSQRGADIVSAQDQNPERPEVNKMKLSEIEKRAPRVAKPPPKAKSNSTNVDNVVAKPSAGTVPGAPPPPPPPPRAPGAPPPPPPPPGSIKSQGATGDKVQRAPEVVEFYQSLMRREAKVNAALGASDLNSSDARNNLIGEIENRSTFLLAVKADVETQGDFVESLAAEVRAASYSDIEDVVAFVSWLDEELSFLVDERAVLKHFDWPENKADALRESAFEYQDLKKLAIEATVFEDDHSLPCEKAFKKMLSLLEKVEASVYALLRTRDMAVARYKEFGIPTQWLLDSGLVGKIKLATVQLARKYMKRVATELDSSTASTTQDPQREFLLLQGVRFAFRVHQFAGGFDAESMRTFEELRDRIRATTEQAQSETGESS